MTEPQCVAKYTPEGTTAALIRSWADELTITQGPTGPLVREMQKVAAELEMESHP